ncbi:MAG: hypothetical protein ACXWC3_16045 [Burkholderiales bacterium]
MKRDIPNVGASDPELRTSPILDDDEEESLDAELETGVCYFNGVPYPIGEYVRSGEEVLPAPAAVYASAREKFEP